MADSTTAQVAIVDYGVGNLFSVNQACLTVGLMPHITQRAADVVAADAVILPGVGAFGSAMEALRSLDLVEPLRDIAQSGKPFVGICLGLQLLMSESNEFGCHKGLNLIEGEVVRLPDGQDTGQRLRVPNIGWNPVSPRADGLWRGSLLEGVAPGERMYFVHSYHVRPSRPDAVIASTPWGAERFDCALATGSIFACQFHPERSGPQGLQMYRNLADRLHRQGRS
jgi:glutamine amidotransferase